MRLEFEDDIKTKWPRGTLLKYLATRLKETSKFLFSSLQKDKEGFG